MRSRILMLVTVAMLLVSCGESSYKQTNDGVIVTLDGNNDSPKYLKVQVVTNDIVRVQGLNDISDADIASLVVVDDSIFGKAEWKLEEADNTVKLITPELTTEIALGSGNIKFIDKDGNIKLQEVPTNGKTMKPFKEGDKTLYSIRQMFESPDDEAFYGLGQHQNGEFNYKGLDVELLQYNIVAVVPFLYSSKNYGILWDNYSITRFGDPRPYENINTLILKDKNGNEGGLTATYYDKDGNVVAERQEQDIDYRDLETVKNIPDSFKMTNNSRIVWEGKVSSNVEGLHKFRLYVASFSKLWIDGELVLDNWRQCWNPWYYKFNIDMKSGESHDIKLEWILDSNISYCSLTCLDSQNESDQQKLSLFSESGNKIDYYFVSGDCADDIVDGYRYLTGKAPIVPKWAMGYWQSRERYKSWEEMINVIKEYRKRDIPFDNIILDWMYWPEPMWGDHQFDPERFANPVENIQAIHDLNAHFMISVWPKFCTNTNNYKLFEENGWLFTKNVDLRNLDWVGPGYLSTFYDAYNPDAREAFWKGINDSLYSKGVDAWWLDAVEPDIHSNVTLAEKKSTITPNYMGSGEQFFNSYSLVQAKGVYEGQRKSDPDSRVFILTRSCFAGQQRYGAVTWSGDVVSRWSDLHDQVRAGLNMSLSGIPYWTTDIGGFDVEKRYSDKEAEHLPEWRELNTRWFQYGVFCPIFRVHGKFPYREMWEIAPTGSKEYNSLVYYTNLRYRLMPYIYSLAGNTYSDNGTIMRPLIMDFENDKNVNNIGDQFMFGQSIMVCPITQFKQYQREIYLPEGTNWFDYYSGKVLNGGQKIVADAPIDRIPLFVKAGSIIPFGPKISYAMEETGKPVKIVVYAGDNGEFTLYEDAGDNYNYENGEFASIKFAYNQENGELSIGKKCGSFGPSNRTFEIYLIKENQTFDFDGKPDATIDYAGEDMVVNL